MRNLLGVLFVTAIVSGCTSSPAGNEYSEVPLTDNELQSEKWSQLDRFPPRYPENAAMNSVEGCATVEYVITPEHEIKDVTVVTATHRQFGTSAAAVVQNWRWSELPPGVITQPVKTQTRFDFCLDQPNQPCAAVTPDYSCPGEDIIYSSGMRMR